MYYTSLCHNCQQLEYYIKCFKVNGKSEYVMVLESSLIITVISFKVLALRLKICVFYVDYRAFHVILDSVNIAVRDENNVFDG